MTPPLRRILGAATLTVAAVLAALPVGGGPGADPRACGLTTLDATVVANPERPGTLKCGPKLTLRVRQDLGASAKPERTSIRDALVSFAAFSDFQLVDEESPLRGEFLDKCGDTALKAAFRWQETMLPAIANAHVQAANAINTLTGAPATGRHFDFAVQLGDAADNQQWNEVRWFMTLLDGSTDPQGRVHLVDPDSGAEGYEGVQGKDPITTPVTGASVRDLANEPFFAPGVRKPDGSPLPWYSVMGNHDMKVNGTIPNNDAWKAFASAWATGALKVTDLPPDDQQRVCADPTVLTDPMFWNGVAAGGHTKVIQADPDRRLLDRTQWIAEHLPHDKAVALDAEATGSYGVPAGHGFLTPAGADNRCKDANGSPLRRACYAFDVVGDTSLPTPIPLHFVALDTSDDDGLDAGNLDQAEYDWLERDLTAHSSTYYDASGAKRTTANSDALIVVFSHHTASRMDNTLSAEKRYGGADLEALFHRFPNVVLHANGHTHYNKVWAHPDDSGKTGGYWEVNTSAIADWPHQSRTIEIADNHDGTISIFGVNFDAAVAPDPRALSWGSDATPERSLAPRLAAGQPALTRDTNEAWLAAAAREVGHADPQAGAATPYSAEDGGADTPDDKNVELLVRNPFGVTQPKPKAPGGICDCGPRFTPRFPPFNLPRFPLPRFPFTPPVPPQQLPRTFASTGPGLGSPAKDRPYIPASEAAMILLAAGGAAWLYRARIRAWMLER